MKKLTENNNHLAVYDYQKPGSLTPGLVSRKYLLGLVAVCEISNQNMIKALEQVLVFGIPRKDACERFSVAASYFSIKIRQLQSMSILLHSIFPCALRQGGCPMHIIKGRVNQELVSKNESV